MTPGGWSHRQDNIAGCRIGWFEESSQSIDYTSRHVTTSLQFQSPPCVREREKRRGEGRGGEGRGGEGREEREEEEERGKKRGLSFIMTIYNYTRKVQGEQSKLNTH